MYGFRPAHTQALIRDARHLWQNFLSIRSLPKNPGGENVREISTSQQLNDGVQIIRKGPVSIIQLDRPKTCNAISVSMWRDLTKAITEVDASSTANVIALAGNSHLFCSGLDLTDFSDAAKASSLPIYAKNTTSYLKKFTSALIDCKKPLVALVHGSAVGVGVSMLPLCDIVYSSDRSTFTMPNGWLGIVPECCSSYTFPKIMGYARASSMLYNNRTMNAQEALSAGLVTELIKYDEFKDETAKLMERLGALPLKPLILSKKLVREDEREILHRVNEKEMEAMEVFIRSKDMGKAVEKFFRKKK